MKTQLSPEYFEKEIQLVRKDMARLDKFLFELLIYTSRGVFLAKRDRQSTFAPWRYADELCNELAGVLVEEPYYVLPENWFRVVTGQIMSNSDFKKHGQAVALQKFSQFCYEIGWDFSKCVMPEMETEEQTVKVLDVKDNIVGTFPIRMVLEPDHRCPIGSRWASNHGVEGVSWTVIDHPAGDLDFVTLQCESGNSSQCIHRHVSRMRSGWRRLESRRKAKALTLETFEKYFPCEDGGGI